MITILLIFSLLPIASYATIRTHTTTDGHNDEKELWWSGTVWTGKPGGSSSYVSDDPFLIAEWNFPDSTSIAADMMYDFEMLDALMVPVITRTQADLISRTVTIKRSSPGLPRKMTVTVLSDTIIGTNGFEQRLAAPIEVRVGLDSLTTYSGDSLFVAHYSGLIDGQSWEVKEPAVDPGFLIYTSNTSSHFELELLTSGGPPTPASSGWSSALLLVVLVASGLGALGIRRA